MNTILLNVWGGDNYFASKADIQLMLDSDASRTAARPG